MKWKNETKRKPKHKRGLHRSAREERNIPFSNLPTSPALGARSPIIGFVGEGRPFPFRYSFAHDPVMMMMIRFHRASPLPGRSLKSLPIDHRHTIVEARSGGCVKSRWQMFIFLLSSYFCLFPFGLRFPPRFLEPSKPTTWRRENYSTHTHTQPHGKA